MVVPDNITITSKPVGFCEEEWERQKKTYVESVKRHMKEKGAANGTALYKTLISVSFKVCDLCVPDL